MQVATIDQSPGCTIADMRLVLNYGLQLAGDTCTLPIFPLDGTEAVILLADILAYPVRTMTLKEQVGRFALVEYEVPDATDPDIIIAGDPTARRFHKEIAAFQQIRQDPYMDWGEWYRAAKEQARRIAIELNLLHPHPLEANFVLRWVALVCAQGRRI